MISQRTKIILATMCAGFLIFNVHIGPVWPGFLLLGWILADWTNLWGQNKS